jgi:hypothetical protein
MSIELLRSLVWMDYRLAVLFMVLIPLALLIWAFVQKVDAIERLLIIYWRVASLFAITVYLMIAELPLSFLTSFSALILIPVSLWFWADLNEEIDDRRGPLKIAFAAWRWSVTLYCGLGAIAQLFFLNCAFSRAAIASPRCQVWLEAPFLFKQVFHANTGVGTLGFIGIVALIVYVLCLLYFVFFKLSRQGRSAARL